MNPGYAINTLKPNWIFCSEIDSYKNGAKGALEVFQETEQLFGKNFERVVFGEKFVPSPDSLPSLLLRA